VASELGIVGATTNERCPLVGVGNGNGVQRAGVRAKAGVGMAETGHHCAETAGMGNNIPNIKMGDGWC